MEDIEKIDISNINQMLHYMKGAEPFSAIFKYLLRNNKNWCPFTHGKKVNVDCYKSIGVVIDLLAWIKKYVFCCKFLDVNRYSIDEMNAIMVRLKNPESLVYYDEFLSATKRFSSLISFLEGDISNKLSRISCKECERLDEALVCFQNYCFYASIVMAVSAVESRIHELMRKTNKKLYLSRFEKFTLGQIIQIFDDNQYTSKEFVSIKKLMPNKHKPLIALLNQYRVFSAHPKEEKITAQIAESVLHLAFNFMMDSSVCPYSKKELACH